MKRFLLLCWKNLFVTLVISAVAGAVLFLIADIIRINVLYGEKIYRSEAMYYITFDAAASLVPNKSAYQPETKKDEEAK